MTTTTEFTKADLPELPEKITVHTVMPDDGWYGNVKAYDHFQMRTYALAAVAAYRKKLMEQEPVFEVGFGWLDDATKYPRGTKLYAAPMSQVNESEAMKALRELVRLQTREDQDDGYSSTVIWRTEWKAAWKAARATLAGEPVPNNPQYKRTKPDAGHPLLQRLIDSIENVEGIACWDFVAMYEVRNALQATQAETPLSEDHNYQLGYKDGYSAGRMQRKAARAVLAGEPGAKGEQRPDEESMPFMYRGLLVAGVIEMASHYVENGHKSSILAEQLRTLLPLFKVESGTTPKMTAQPMQTEQPKQAQAMDEREAIKQIIIEHLTGVYICNRVWEAWNVGTMDQDDFELALETELPDELADALMARSALAVSKTSEQNLYLAQSGVKDNQARAALAQAQDVGPTQQQEAALQALADEAQALGLYEAQAQASGKHCLHPTNCFDHANGNLCDDCLGKPQASGKAAPSDEECWKLWDKVRSGFAAIEKPIPSFARALLERYGNASKNGAMAAGREGNDV